MKCAIINMNQWPLISDCPSPAYPSNGQIATQEELDSVIDFLSRGLRQPAMAAIPENQLPVMSRAVGSHLAGPQLVYQPQPRIVGLMPYPPPPQPQAQPQFQHRLSDGLLADSLPRDARTNTWPIKPSQRHTIGQEMVQMMQMCGGVENLPFAAEADYSQYLYPVKPKQPGDLLPGNNMWTPAGEGGLQRMWQYPGAAPDRWRNFTVFGLWDWEMCPDLNVLQGPVLANNSCSAAGWRQDPGSGPQQQTPAAAVTSLPLTAKCPGWWAWTWSMSTRGRASNLQLVTWAFHSGGWLTLYILHLCNLWISFGSWKAEVPSCEQKSSETLTLWTDKIWRCKMKWLCCFTEWPKATSGDKVQERVSPSLAGGSRGLPQNFFRAMQTV